MKIPFDGLLSIKNPPSPFFSVTLGFFPSINTELIDRVNTIYSWLDFFLILKRQFKWNGIERAVSHLNVELKILCQFCEQIKRVRRIYANPIKLGGIPCILASLRLELWVRYDSAAIWVWINMTEVDRIRNVGMIYNMDSKTGT